MKSAMVLFHASAVPRSSSSSITSTALRTSHWANKVLKPIFLPAKPLANVPFAICCARHHPRLVARRTISAPQETQAWSFRRKRQGKCSNDNRPDVLAWLRQCTNVESSPISTDRGWDRLFQLAGRHAHCHEDVVE